MSGKFPQEIMEVFDGVLRSSRDNGEWRGEKFVVKSVSTKTSHMHVLAGVFLICCAYLLVIFWERMPFLLKKPSSLAKKVLLECESSV